MTMVVRDALLDRPALRGADAVGDDCDIKVDEGTITEDFSDLTLLKGERFLAASFLSYDLSLYETVTRATTATLLTNVVNETLIEKVANAPTVLSASVGNTQSMLSWRAPTWDGGGTFTITGYTVQYSVDNGTTWSTTVADTGATDPAHIVTGLTNGTTYQFRVAAINGAGTGAYSSASLSVTPSA